MPLFKTDNADNKRVLELFNTNYILDESEIEGEYFSYIWFDVCFMRHPKELEIKHIERGSKFYHDVESMNMYIEYRDYQKVWTERPKLPFTVFLEVYNSKLIPLTDEIREQIKQSLSECDNRASFLYVLGRYAKTYAMYSPDEQLFIIELSILEHDNTVQSDYIQDLYWGNLNSQILTAIRQFT